MRIDIWSDVVCPFCYIGRRRLEAALERFEHRDEVRIVWRSFELDPTTTAGENTPVVELMARKYRMSAGQAEAQNAALAQQAESVGLTFNWAEAKNANTFDAHRLVHLAAMRGDETADELEQRLMRAYFTEGRAVDSHDVLVEVAVEAGLDEAEVRAVLAGDRFAEEVRSDEEAARQLGITGVPFFVVAEKFAVSGAQPVEVFVQALEQGWDHSRPHPFEMVVGEGIEAGGPACGPEGCDVRR